MVKRVVITGMGVISAVGMDLDQYWEAVQKGISGVVPIKRFDTSSFRTKIAAEIQNFHAKNYIDSKQIDRMDRFSHFSIAATQHALDDSRVECLQKRSDIGVILGTSVGGIYSHEMTCSNFFTQGYASVSPLAIPVIMHNAAACNIARQFGFTGNNYTISTACSSASNAIGEAYRCIKHGYSEMIVTGGADATLSPVFLSAWNKLRVLSEHNDDPTKACKPFSKNRNGFVIGEGAGILILESLSSAKKRNAKIYAEIIGYGNTNDAHHLTFPNMEQQVQAVRMAMAEAGLTPEQIDYINAHGTGTKANDKVETETIKTVFGKHACSIPISSIKPVIGHTLGASGAMELIACVLAMTHGTAPPTINYDVPDPECDLDYVPNHHRVTNIDIAMSNSFAFGGGNVVLIIKKVAT
jgi:3-oxoacyl-[acyl-carrier-protein] synthase II